jgi:hypothetical protein
MASGSNRRLMITILIFEIGMSLAARPWLLSAILTLQSTDALEN